MNNTVSLKTRLQLSIVLLNLCLVLLYSMVHVYSITEVRQQNFAERASAVADQVQAFLQEHLNSATLAAAQPPQNILELKDFWYRTAQNDPQVQSMLETSFGSTRVLSRILLLDAQGRVLVSSNILDTENLGRLAPDVLPLERFQSASSFSRMATIFTETQEIAIDRSLGVGDDEIFKIRVILSSLLLRDAVMEQLRYLLPLSVFAFALAFALALFVSNLATRQLVKVSQAIDRIAAGDQDEQVPASQRSGFKEYDVVESKLQMLGQQIRGAKQDALSMQESVRRLLARTEKAVMLFDGSDCLISAGENVEPLLNRPKYELIGKTYENIFPSNTKLGALILRAVSLKSPVKDQLVMLERPGLEPIQVYASVEPMDQFAGWEKVGTLVTLRDAESQAAIQSQLDVSTRLAAISRLTSGVAHEIKNPLNAMNLHLEILKAQIDPEDERGRNEIEIIGSEITRLNRVVNTFLDFTRPVELKPQNLNLNEIVAATAELFQPQVRAKGFQLTVTHPAEAVFVRGDKDLLKQALLNLVSNAIESMDNTGNVLLELVRDREDCILRVSDEGCGIPEAIQDRIFQLYFSTKAKGKGSGIGLAMTFQIVQFHGGSIWFESEVSKGTTFWIRLPLVGSGAGVRGIDAHSAADPETPAQKVNL